MLAICAKVLVGTVWRWRWSCPPPDERTSSIPGLEPGDCHVGDCRQQAWLQQVRIEYAHAAPVLTIAILDKLAETEALEDLLASVIAKSLPSFVSLPRRTMPNRRLNARP
jgi:hypothetical protein